MITKEIKTVVFDAERLKHKNVGLFHFCLQLGNALIDVSDMDPSLDLWIYTSKINRYLKDNPNYLNVKNYHKFYFPINNSINVWHATHQLTDFLPRSNRIHKILTIHDLNFIREKSLSKQKKYFDKVQKNIDMADRIVCISEFVKNEVIQYMNLRDKECSVIYNGNNIPAIIKLQPITFSNLDFNIPFLFFVGAILPKKNLEALPYLLVGNKLNLLIAGEIFDKPYSNSIIELGKKLGVAERIFFLGSISEEQKFYLLKNCRYFCFPSKTEGFGLPVVEAMSFGKDILLSKATSLPEIGGEVVRYFDSYEPEYLINLGNSLESFQFSEDDEKSVIDRSKMFDWANAAKSYWKIYKESI